MSKQTRYLLTVDSATGAAVKLERLGEAGDLTEVPLSTLAVSIPGAQPMAGVGAPPAPQPLVINIYMGGPQQAAPVSVPVPGLAGPGAPGGPGVYAALSGPAAPGGPGGQVTQLQGPGGPGVTTATTTQGPGGPGGTTSGGEEGGSR